MIEPLVLLPGLMFDARLFHPQIDVLSRSRAVTVAPVSMGERIEEIASGLLDQLPQPVCPRWVKHGRCRGVRADPTRRPNGYRACVLWRLMRRLIRRRSRPGAKN